MTDLRVLEIFDSLQGEGYWTGTPMTFVRLAGCNAPDLGLGCVRWCDTPGSWEPEGGEAMSPEAVIDRVHFPRLCLTGGEPLLQGDTVAILVDEAHRRGLRVHLETNGTVAPPLDSDSDAGFDWVVVSPKPPSYPVAAEWAGLVDELKLVVDETLDATTAERLAARHPEAIVSIQPVAAEGRPVAGGAEPGEGGDGPEARAVRLVMEHPEWRLSLQTHKYLGIR